MGQGKKTVSYIGLGSNLGDRDANISRAIFLLQRNQAVKLLRASSVIETEPMHYEEQPKFLNCVAKIETTLSPRELIRELKAIEKRVGRKESSVRWGPREIDLDILLYGEEYVNEPDLKIPHPRMHERPFVMEPLSEVK